MYEPPPPRMGYWSLFLSTFVPCTVVTHLWAYGHLAKPDRTEYIIIAGAAYLVPLAASAIISVVAGRLRRVTQNRNR